MSEMEKRIIRELSKSRKPLNKRDLSTKAGGRKNNRSEFNIALNSLLKTGEIIDYKGRYTTPRKLNLTEGVVANVSGTFGFVTPAKEGEKDIFVPGRFLKGAMPGDKVLLKVSESKSGQLKEGEVFSVTEEVNTPFVGVLGTTDRNELCVIPDKFVKFPMLVTGYVNDKAEIGDKVLVQVVHRNQRHSGHKVKVLAHFGSSDSAAICAEAILAENNIETSFPDEVIAAAKAIPQTIHPKELKARVDLRDENIFTIDGADTKDIDDAISLKKTATGWELGVHIADVSYYVHRKSPLDEEAFARGCSVYYADKVIPMLPKELSNGICSLNPQEDRLAFSAIINLDKQGEIENYDFQKTVIRSRLKGVYSEINEILEKKASKEILNKYSDQLEVLEEMRKLAAALNKKRSSRNSINLESSESKIIVNAQGVPVDIVKRAEGISENIIEEFMLVANEAAATFAMKRHLPFVYRVHEDPDNDRLESFYTLLDSLGISYQRPRENQSPAASFAKVLKEVKGGPYDGIVNHSMLRTMAKAKYSAKNLGHFGLGLENYAHFTSPIRRYPDLAIHRILTGLLTGMRKENIDKYFGKWVTECSTQSTNREIASMMAERSATDCYHAEYMGQFIGQEFDGVVSSTTNFGIFIELENTVEGLIHTDRFPPGNWEYDNMISFKNQTGKGVIRIGDSVKVRVIKTDVASGTIDFEFAQPEIYR